jgi:Uma2 family endonuclease
MSTVRKSLPRHMSLSEFLVWEREEPSPCHWILVDGEPVAMAPANRTHGAIQNELGAMLRNHLLERGSPCRALTQPGVVPKLRAHENFRIPDIGVTFAPPSADLMVAEPVLLVEILSPSNEVETRANVWAYASIPTVKEILVIHTTRVAAAELLRRDATGQWPDDPLMLKPDDDLMLESIDFRVRLRSIHRTTVLASA